ncbi:MAG: ABC transporter permease subunit [Chloroflexi bacterium]|nr:ABC transporter permease subunit [Chloroflexota bacterium]
MIQAADRDTLLSRQSIRLITVVVEREVRDTLRDWRIVAPILVLTIFFPALMSFVADLALDWVAKYEASIVGERLLPFLLMVVGFFPISFSLVIALETFVGEKERRSLEPLLATPLTDAQLYIGKMLAATIPPLVASYLGILVYLAGLHLFKGWAPPTILVALVLILTLVESLVMVSGAVVVSSQTTSVRAANLLASFIIIPMALLIQGEAIIMFWANYHVLWLIVLFLIIVDIVLIRMGIQTFNREELLGQEIDELNVASIWRTFTGYLRWAPWPPLTESSAITRRWLASLVGLYRYELPAILHRARLALIAVSVGLLLSGLVGYGFAARHPLPSNLIHLDQISIEAFSEVSSGGWLPEFSTWGIWTNNVRALLIAAVLGVFSFGVIAIILLMAPLSIVAFFAAQAAHMGYSPLLFLAAFVLPHGVIELPAAVVATALAVRLGAAVMTRPRDRSMSEGWLSALADFAKGFIAIVLPLLALAAVLEVYITPWVVIGVFGR